MVRSQRSSIQQIIDTYKAKVDRSVLRAQLALTPEERLRRCVVLAPRAPVVRGVGDEHRSVPRSDGRSSMDDVIAVYARDVDRTLLRENLKLTPTERLRNLQRHQAFAEELQRAGRAHRRSARE